MHKKLIIPILIILIFAISPMYSVSALATDNGGKEKVVNNANVADWVKTIKDPDRRIAAMNTINEAIDEKIISHTSNGTFYPDSWKFIEYLKNNPNDYQKIWEPWLTKAAVHSIVVSSDGDMMAFGGGYLYDNEIHVYRWNYEKNCYDKVWDSGDGIIKGDILSLAFGDTDNNNLMEIIAGSADGHVYVFEQRHIYDPITNTEFMFDLVWKSKYLGPVWSVKVMDLDSDFKKDIIAGAWESGITIYEYFNHSRYPFYSDHWIEYSVVWSDKGAIKDKVYSIATGDFNGNGLKDFIVGTRSGGIYVYENNGTVIKIKGYNFPFSQDNSYKIIYNNSYAAYAPILSISVGDTDGDDVDEASIVAATQSVFVLDYQSGYFSLIKLYYPIWRHEKGAGVPGEYPIDNWMDWMIRGQNVWFYNGTLWMKEPLPNYRENTGIEYNNTAMGGPTDNKYSQFVPNATHNASALLDFGIREESVGDGTPSWDMYIVMKQYNSSFALTPNSSEVTFYGSEDGSRYIVLNDYFYFTGSGTTYIYFDVDKYLRENDWRHIRYLKIEVKNGSRFYAFDSIYTKQIDKQLTDVLSSYITKLNLFYDVDKYFILLGTINGRIVVYHYNETSDMYEMLYDSYDLDYYMLGTHIWYITKTKDDTRYPYWVRQSDFTLDLGGETFLSYYPYDYDHDGDKDLIVSTYQGGIRFFKNSGGSFTLDTYAGDMVSDILTEYPDVKTVAMGDILSSPGDEFIIGYKIGSTFRILVFYLENPYIQFYNATNMVYLDDYEMTGNLMGALSLGMYPDFAIGDIDGDGDNDIVISNKEVLLLLHGKGDNFYLLESYFDGVNEASGTRISKHVQLVNFNLDDKMDIVVSFYNKHGAKYFENIGTVMNPKWVEKKQMFSNSAHSTEATTNYSFNNYTEPVILKENGEYKLISYDTFNKKWVVFKGETSLIDTLLVATYPLVIAINTGPITTTGSYLNFGYHILDVWNTRDELRGWTQAIAHGDVDGDGKGEIIVGDYDNNVYIFEHLINNTYKRAFRSPDLYYEYETDQSPYYSGSFGGIEETFKRRVWDHARFIAADTDIDNNGRKEIIVATTFDIYVFEHIGYENYRLTYKYSLLNSTIGDNLLEYTDGITAFAYAGDLDFDGFGEIVVAVNNYMFIIELTKYGFLETYYGDEEKYALPGQPIGSLYIYALTYINAIVVGDIDDNGLKEIIIGGLNKTSTCESMNDGFVLVIETQPGTYYLKWSMPRKLLLGSPVNTLAIDDQDYDGYKELIVGGKRGIIVLEHTETNYLEYRGVITSDPDYPSESMINYFNNYTMAQRSIEYQDLVVGSDGHTYVFVSRWDSRYTGEKIVYSVLKKETNEWSTWVALTSSSEYGNPSSINEIYPTVVRYHNLIYIVWYAQIDSQYGIYWKYINTTSGTVSSLHSIVNFTSDQVFNLRAWTSPSSLITLPFSFSYINRTDYKLYIWKHVLQFVPPYYFYTIWVKYSFYKINDTSNNSYMYYMHDIDYIGNSTWGMVFTGYKVGEGSFYDLWYTTFNSSFYFTSPTRLVRTPWFEVEPVISYNETSNSLVSVFTAYKSGIMSELYAISSPDRGKTWSDAYVINRFNPRITVTCYYGSKTLTYNTSSGQIVQLTNYRTFAPAAYVSQFGTFVYGTLMTMEYWTPNHEKDKEYDGSLRIINNLNWVHTKLGEIKVIATGDTDLDARKEIVSNYFDDSFTVFEISQKTDKYFMYNQTFIGYHLNNTVFDISIGDSNGNGWPEIAVSSDMGNVYAFEFRFYNWATSNFSVPKLYKQSDYEETPTTTQFYGTFSINNETDGYYMVYNNNKLVIYTSITTPTYNIWTSGTGSIMAIKTGDTDSDGVDEFYIGLNNGTLIKLSANGEVLGKYNGQGSVVVDIDIIYSYIVIADGLGKIYALNAEDLSEFTPSVLDLGTYVPYVAGLLNTEGELEGIAVRFNNETIKTYSFNSTGYTLEWALNTSISQGVDFLVSDFNGDGASDLAIQNTTTQIIFVRGLDYLVLGTVDIEESGIIKWMYPASLDGDEFPDIIFIGSESRGAITTETFEVLWQSKMKLEGAQIIWGDFDNDGSTDFAVNYDSKGITVIYNGYGSTLMYYQIQVPPEAYLAIGSKENSKGMLFGLLSNGSYIVVAAEDYLMESTTEAYWELKQTVEKQVLERAYDNVMIIDLNASSGDKWLLVASGIYMSGVKLDGEILFTGKFGDNITSVSKGHNAGDKSEYAIIATEHEVFVVDENGDRVSSFELSSETIYEAMGGDFNGDGKGDIAVRTNETVYVTSSTGSTIWKSTDSYGAMDKGDFNSDGKPEIVLKKGTTLYVWDPRTNTLMWSKTYPYNLYDLIYKNFFVMDYSLDGMDDIVYITNNGDVYFEKGDSGTTIFNFNNGFGGTVLAFSPDFMFGHPDKGIIIKIAGVGLVVYSDTGSRTYTFEDDSWYSYQFTFDNEGKYIGFSRGYNKIFGVNKFGVYYMVKSEEKIMNFIVFRWSGGSALAYVTESGMLNIYGIKEYSLVKQTVISEKQTQNQTTLTIGEIMITMVVLVSLIMIIPISKRKRD
ncbi:MAG: FG-GAP repeat domain-containing protein [Candidatus Njordarchaeia archaeon]